jgi:hypothetical protein
LALAVVCQIEDFGSDQGLDFVILDKEIDGGWPYRHVLTNGKLMLDLFEGFVEACLTLFNDPL